MPNAAPPVGLTHTQSIQISADLTVPRVSPHFPMFQDMPPVFATAMMVGYIEDTCVAALQPHLAPGQRSVGTHVDVSHCAATPVGRTVTCTAELVEVEGRRLRFKVICRDDRAVIGEGFHERHLIDLARFLAKLDA
jgi:fluoroacetyl-CoA thioesterase